MTKNMNVENLKEKTAKGVEWGFIDNLGGTGILAVVNLVLARLLTPQEFGIVGMTSIFITLSTSLVDSGFTGALTRKATVDEKDLNTVFYFNLLTSCVLYAVLFFTAPLIAVFFSQPVLTGVIRILGLSLIVTALSIVQKVILVRKLDFRTQAIVSVVSAVVSGAAGIWMAAAGFGVWSLVVMQLLRLALATVLLWLFSRWMPAFLFSVSSFREMFSFGGRLLLTAVISTVWSEIYSFIIGKVYAPSVLGQYSRADKFRNMVTSNVSIVMQRVTYPVLASIRDEKQRQARAYRKILRTTVLISFTSVLGLAAAAESFVLTLVGEQWVPAVGYLRILCLSGLFIPLMMCSSNIINANGRSDTTLYLEIMKTVLAVIPVLGFNWMTCGVPAVVPGHTANVLGAYHGEAVKEGVAATAWAMMTNLPGQVRCFFSNYEIPNSLSFYAHGEILGFLRVFAVPANVLLLLALLGGVGFFRRRGVQLTVLLIAAYVGSMLFFTFFYRFRVPVMGPVCVLAGGGLVFLGHLWRGKKWWQLGAAGLFLVLGMILTWQSPHVMRPAGERRSVVALLILLDRLEEAETLLDGLQQDRIGCTDLAARLYGRLRETGAMEAADRIGRRYGRRVEP